MSGLDDVLPEWLLVSDLPPRANLPRYLTPLPRRLEDFGLRIAPLVVLINLVGTVFGFWWYGISPFSGGGLIEGQFAAEPLLAWPVVPDSPMATLFIAVSLGFWVGGRSREWVNALAFFGCIKLGAWTPFVLLAFADGFSGLHPLLFHFLFWSHLAMVAEAFLIHRYSDFPVDAVAVALLWYGGNDVLDYFLPVVGGPHHSWIPPEFVDGRLTHSVPAHDVAAVAAVVLTLLATFLALATRVKKLEATME